MTYKVFDIGYGYLKYSDESGKIVKVKSVIAELGDSMHIPEDCDIFTVDGIDYIVGDDVYRVGKKPLTANENKERPKNKVYKVLGLYALSKMGVVGQCGVVTGLPHQQLDDEADMVKKVFSGSHKVTLNGNQCEIDITDVRVASQGYGTYYSLVKQRGKDTGDKKILLIDMGFRTIIYIPVMGGNIDKKLIRTSRQMGIQKAYGEIVDLINKEYGKNYKFYRVDEFLDDGVPLQDGREGKERESIQEKGYVLDTFNEYARDVWNDIVDKYDDDFLEELDEIVFSGGSALRVDVFILENAKQHCSIMNDSQDAQVNGYGIIAEKLSV